MRSKEEAHDYRYFPDPDLVPMEVARDEVARLMAALPALPWQRFERYTREYALAPKQATQLIDNLSLAAYFDRVVAAGGNPQQASNFVLGELSGSQTRLASRLRTPRLARASRRADRARRSEAHQLEDR